jgi:hypothetical protein
MFINVVEPVTPPPEPPVTVRHELSLSTLAKRSRRSHSITPSRAQNPVKTASVERDIQDK